MNTSFDKSADKYTDEWYTPQHIIQSIPISFDLDPCSPVNPLYEIARHTFNIEQNGLTKDWSKYGEVWLNPPYSKPLFDQFLQKMVDHNNGVALMYNRLDTKLFQETLLPLCTGLLIVAGRVRFLKPDGTQGGTPGSGSVLMSFGDTCGEALSKCTLNGYYVNLAA